MSADLVNIRLFVAALGNDSVEVIDAAAQTHVRSLTGLRKPQGVLVIPGSNRMVVTNSARPARSPWARTATMCASMC
jgi:hypothetical protein